MFCESTRRDGIGRNTNRNARSCGICGSELARRPRLLLYVIAFPIYVPAIKLQTLLVVIAVLLLRAIVLTIRTLYDGFSYTHFVTIFRY